MITFSQFVGKKQDCPCKSAVRPLRHIWKVVGTVGLAAVMSSMVFGQANVQRDQQALTLLSQVIAAGGGQDLISSIQDATETGTATYYFSPNVTAPITIKERGLHEIRIDADLPEGRRSTVINAMGGSLREAGGRFRPISRQSISDLRSMTSPFLPIIAAIQDSSTEIVYAGLMTHNGAPAYDIRVQKSSTSVQGPRNSLGAHARDFYIDPKSLMVTAICDQIRFSDSREMGVPHEILYSNYQPQSGIAMPMTISETVRGVTGLSIQLTQVTFNSGLSDSDFDNQ